LASIGVWTAFALIPAGILFGAGLSVRNHDATFSAALIAIAVGAILLVSAASLATHQVFSVALYRYANGAPDTRGFAAADLEEPFRRRGGRS
jgi:fucose permease